jgi:general secretion pathway protein A
MIGVAGGALALGVVLAMLALPKSPVTMVQAPPVATPTLTAPPPSTPASPLPTSDAPPRLPAPVPGPLRPLAGIETVLAAAATDETVAWRALADLWGVALGPGDPCVAGQAQALHCHHGRGGLTPIRLLGRPVVLPLVDDRGRTVHAMLTALSDDRATLRAGRAEVVVPLAQLTRAWRGEFGTFWRAPPGYRPGQVVARDSALGPWLTERLARAEGGAPAASAATLESRVFNFQLANGLLPDGAAGPLTLMLLNRASGVDEPRLPAVR